VNNKLHSKNHIWKEYWTGVQLPSSPPKKKSTTKWCEFFLLGMSELKRRKSKMSGGTFYPTRLDNSPHLHQKKSTTKVVRIFLLGMSELKIYLCLFWLKWYKNEKILVITSSSL